MVDYLELCRDKLNFRADEFFPDFHHRTSAVIADLFPFIQGMKYFSVREIFHQFFPLAGVFPFAEMFLHLDKIRFMCVRIRTGFDLIKKRHLTLDFESRCLLGFCSIKFTGQEINLLF